MARRYDVRAVEQTSRPEDQVTFSPGPRGVDEALTKSGFSLPKVSPFAFLSSLNAFRLETTAAFSLSAYSHPAGDRSESALYECSIRDCPDYLSYQQSPLPIQAGRTRAK